MLLYLVRHAQSEGNALVPGATIDCGLTDLGQRQAAAVAERLAGLGIDRVLSSPYLRTLQTAEAIRHATGAAAEIAPLLHEHHQRAFGGEWPLLSRAAIVARFPGFGFPETWTDVDWHRPPETDDAALNRAHRVLADLWARFAATPQVRLAVVSHGSPTGKLVLAFMGVTSMAGRGITIDNASLSILELWPEWRRLGGVNLREHLAGMMTTDPVYPA